MKRVSNYWSFFYLSLHRANRYEDTIGDVQAVERSVKIGGHEPLVILGPRKLETAARRNSANIAVDP